MRQNSSSHNSTAGAADGVARRSAIAEEQAFLDLATARRDTLADHLRTELSSDPADAVERARQRMLRRQHEELRRAREGLVFGRLDARDGTVRHVGRVGLRDDGEDGEPLLLDWRAPAARPFYTATAVDPQGQARRRHIRTTESTVVGVDDEPLDGTTTAELVGEGALLAALDERRTGHMSTAVATLQREQDDIIRAEATGPLIVQGGPGTGKTVVALHRVAYLLFAHPTMAEQAVLVLGPSPRFLRYIAQVLPALGETAVVSATCDTLLPGIRVGRDESRPLAEIKGRALWQPALENYVTSLLPRPRELKLRWEGEFHVIPAATVAQALVSAVQGRPYHRARTAFAEQLHHILADAVVAQREALMDEMEEGFEDILARVDRSMRHDHVGRRATGSDVDGLLSEEEVESLPGRIAANAAIARFVQAWWPSLDAETLLRDLLADRALLARFAPGSPRTRSSPSRPSRHRGRRATFPCSTRSPTCWARSRPRSPRASSSPTTPAGDATGCTATSSSTRRRSCPRCSGRWSFGAVPVAPSPRSATSTRRRPRTGTPAGPRRYRRSSGTAGPPRN